MKRLFATTLICLLASEFALAENSLKSPNVSANALFLYRNSNFAKEDTSTIRNGLDLQEAELAFYADVDPYSRLDLTLALHPEYALNTTTNQVEQSWVIEPEELFAESNHISSTTLRIGKFKAAFGKHNRLHAHAYPFVDAPIANSAFLGDEGLNDIGVSAAFLLPTPWYSELTAQYLRGEGENAQFNSPSSDDGIVVGRWQNLWDLSEALTLELGASHARGNNSLRRNTELYGADLTFKWRPSSGGKYKSWILASEYINRNLQQTRVDIEKGAGWNIWAQYQLAERWSTLARYERQTVSGSDLILNPNALENIKTKKYSGAVVFNATEFSSLRAEYSLTEGPASASGKTSEKKIYLQASFTIGSHPSHSY